MPRFNRTEPLMFNRSPALALGADLDLKLQILAAQLKQELLTDESLKGDKGNPGADGVGIKDIAASNGKLIFTFTDGKTTELEIGLDNLIEPEEKFKYTINFSYSYTNGEESEIPDFSPTNAKEGTVYSVSKGSNLYLIATEIPQFSELVEGGTYRPVIQILPNPENKSIQIQVISCKIKDTNSSSYTWSEPKIEIPEGSPHEDTWFLAFECEKGKTYSIICELRVLSKKEVTN